jgi:uncharacterized protein (TIGR02453 family)
MRLMAVTTRRFRGFPADGIPFFLELQERQSRDWFAANKARYERLWAEPMRALVAELPGAVADAYPRMAEVQPHIFRIQRDVRFSADKSPYKTNVAASLPTRPGDGPVPGIYLAFGLAGETVAMGCWELGGDHLARYRRAIDDERSGAQASAIVARLQGRGFELTSHEALKRPPAPYARDHARADLLRRKGLAVWTSNVPDGMLDQPELLDWIAGEVRATAPLAEWLERIVG